MEAIKTSEHKVIITRPCQGPCPFKCRCPDRKTLFQRQGKKDDKTRRKCLDKRWICEICGMGTAMLRLPQGWWMSPETGDERPNIVVSITLGNWSFACCGDNSLDVSPKWLLSGFSPFPPCPPLLQHALLKKSSTIGQEALSFSFVWAPLLPCQ